MEQTTVIYAHPYEQSFNHGILARVEKILNQRRQEYTVIDLYQDKFNPVYTKEELAYFQQGKALDPLIERYQAELKTTKQLILIFPIWWYDTPAILKGFFDKVMLYQFAYEDTSTGIKGKLTNIEHATVITTSKSPTWYLKWFGGNAVNKVLIQSTLKGVGVKNANWLNMAKINSSTQEARTEFLDKLDRMI